ncbi:hypothetical protein MG293_001793 [Ovis ammon polii]|uniref:Uncharacterized protein n=1 Tax=Ovis ammon polii TaxID=230172 RepID=A0AAD4YIG0_OVIAM|nr:hypothetical protein MG293_001793 [Ovis ammon polii]
MRSPGGRPGGTRAARQRLPSVSSPPLVPRAGQRGRHACLARKSCARRSCGRSPGVQSAAAAAVHPRRPGQDEGSFRQGSLRAPWASQVTLVVKNPPGNAGDARDCLTCLVFLELPVSPADAPGRDQKGAAQASPADACRFNSQMATSIPLMVVIGNLFGSVRSQNQKWWKDYIGAKCKGFQSFLMLYKYKLNSVQLFATP